MCVGGVLLETGNPAAALIPAQIQRGNMPLEERGVLYHPPVPSQNAPLGRSVDWAVSGSFVLRLCYGRFNSFIWTPTSPPPLLQ